MPLSICTLISAPCLRRRISYSTVEESYKKSRKCCFVDVAHFICEALAMGFLMHGLIQT
ncbi:MAG: hypothetical protein JWR61_4555 [Ferruginibacter sp.]|nr:hypothetical protein [Ferruginibacter sp.]